ncbi:unnamed protein product [Leptidea sinapis]|uniref:Telomeric repeat-binding factor 2-interacting protein 1 n=1 Tax=Leptidea sinapis TaxID=189913 RepID=A0A5E4PQX8_9NEOP|nr:unnamed protein product [Leptidea sinapis]
MLCKILNIVCFRSRTRTDYSRLEDQLIVDWILKHQKAELVKGNSIWREIEPYHLIITGIKRSWQSLRNRYIRSILPFLHNYSVTAQQASELRAGAATGSISKRTTPRSAAR